MHRGAMLLMWRGSWGSQRPQKRAAWRKGAGKRRWLCGRREGRVGGEVRSGLRRHAAGGRGPGAGGGAGWGSGDARGSQLRLSRDGRAH